MPVDGRIISLDEDLFVDESTITGETNLVAKTQGSLCYTSTLVTYGSAFLIAAQTGKNSFIGRTISLVQGLKSRAPNAVPRQMAQYNAFLRRFGMSVLAPIIVSVLLSRLIGSKQLSFQHTVKLFISMSIVAVKFLPKASVSTYRALGASQLLQHGCIAQSHAAVEALAGIDVICCDKTGTITENRLTLLEPYCVSSDSTALILTASLCCTPERSRLDSIERAVRKALKHFPQARASVDRYGVLDFQPFDADTRTTRALVQSPHGEQVLCASGAPKAILDLCFQWGSDKLNIQESYKDAARDYARRGLRAIGVARRRENERWELLGLLPMHDPCRVDSLAAVRLVQKLSVSFRLFTGDAAVIATQLCESIGMDSADVLNASFEDEESMLNPEQVKAILAAKIYAEVGPETKGKILEALQNHDYLVAIGGDGTLDAPSLRNADCGIAVDGSTETAQSASDVVFNKPGLWHIIQALQMSRQIFQQSHNCVIRRAVLTINVFFIILWCHFVEVEAFCLHLLILATNVSDMIEIVYRTSCQDVAFSSQPVRWSFRRISREVIPLAVTTVAGSIACMLMLNSQPAFSSSTRADLGKYQGQTLSIRSQVSTLYILLSDHLMSCLINSDGRFWMYPQNLKVLRLQLGFDMILMIACNRGWAGQNCHLSTTMMCWIVVILIGASSIAACLRHISHEGQLIARPIVATVGGCWAEEK